MIIIQRAGKFLNKTSRKEQEEKFVLYYEKIYFDPRPWGYV